MGLFGRKTAESVEVRGIELRCVICRHDRFWQRKAQLNTTLATFFNFDWANASAVCYVCDGCGYVHWFLPQP